MSYYLGMNHAELKKLIITGKLDIDDNNLLHMAVKQKNVDLVHFMLTLPMMVDINKRDKDNHTALYYAVENDDNIEVLKILLQENDISFFVWYSSDIEGCQTAMDVAKDLNCVKVMQILLANNRVFDAFASSGDLTLHLAVQHENFEIVKTVLHGLDNNHADCEFALKNAILYGRDELFDSLLENYDIDVNSKDSTPLLLSARFAQMHMLFRLLSIGHIDINITDACGWTALHAAVTHDHNDVVEKLLEHEDIDIHIKNRNEMTALDMAKKLRYAESRTIVHLLENHIKYKN